MKTKQSGRSKKPSKWYVLFACIWALIFLLPIYVVIRIKDFFTNRKISKRTLCNATLDEKLNTPPIPYKEPISPVDDREFISRINEFTCFQFKRFNRLSGRSHNYQLLASESPEFKEYVLQFLDKHPVENLLYGNINCNGYDMDHWEIRIIFEDENLNRCIHGYGITEASVPFLCELVPYLVRKQK